MYRSITKRTMFVGAVFGGLLSCLVTSSNAQTVEDCSGAFSQRDMDACTEAAFLKSEAALKALLASIRSNLDDSDYDQRTREALLKSQRAWLVFRDAECEDLLYAIRNGSGFSQFKSSCMNQMTIERIQSLKDLMVEG